VEIRIVVEKYQWVVENLSYEWTVRDTLFCEFLSLSGGDSLLRYKPTSVWLGGMFVPSKDTLLFFNFVYENGLYVVGYGVN